MTIIQHGKEYAVQTFGHLENRLDVDGEEVMLSLTQEKQNEIVDEYNEYCGDWGEDPVESVEELPQEVFDEYLEWVEMSLLEITDNVLYAREQEYVLINNPSAHFVDLTIVEVNTDQNEN